MTEREKALNAIDNAYMTDKALERLLKELINNLYNSIGSKADAESDGYPVMYNRETVYD